MSGPAASTSGDNAATGPAGTGAPPAPPVPAAPIDPADPADPGVAAQPRPRAPTAVVVLAVLAVGYTLWAAQGLVLPVLLAMFFALVGNPIIRLLQRLQIPRFVGALMVLVLGIYSAVMLGRELTAPAAEWMREIPSEMQDIAPKLRKLTRPVQEANQAAENIARAAGGETERKVEVVRTEADDPYKALTSTPKMVAAVLAVVLLTFFFMVYGASLQKNALALLPGRQQKKLTVEILQAIEHEVSRYVLTISLINVLVGVLYALILHFALEVPVDEALLWGTMATLLNFAPYVGPLIGIIAMLAMGLLSYDGLWQSLLPAGIYLGLHTLEGQLLTPIVLGARMALSPLVLILALMLFGWLWGIVGLLLAVPLLVCVKIVLAKIEGLDGWAKLLE